MGLTVEIKFILYLILKLKLHSAHWADFSVKQHLNV